LRDSSDPKAVAGVCWAAFVGGPSLPALAKLDEAEQKAGVCFGESGLAYGGAQALDSGWLSVRHRTGRPGPFVGGAYAAWEWPRGCGAVRRCPAPAHGQVFWAAPRSASAGPGFFEGAMLRSGEGTHAAAVQQTLD